MTDLTPAEEDASPVYAYIFYVLQTKGISATELARMAKVSPSTITRFMNGKGYKFTPSWTTLRKIQAATGIPPGPFMLSKDHAARSALAHDEDDLKQGIVLIGDADARAARIANIELLDEWQYLPVISTQYPTEDCFAVVYRGDNLNKMFKEDGIALVCVKFEKYTFGLQDGLVAVVEWTLKADPRYIAVSARTVRKSDGGGWLFEHQSSNPIFNENDTILANSDLTVVSGGVASHGARFKVLGLVMFAFQYMQPPEDWETSITALRHGPIKSS